MVVRNAHGSPADKGLKIRNNLYELAFFFSKTIFN